MADEKISALTDGGTVQAADQIPVDRAGANFRVQVGAAATQGVPTGLVKGDGSAFSAAVAGSDYLTPSGSGAALTGITAGQVAGLAASATTDTTNAANISSGTLPAARLPNPTTLTLGGIEAIAAVPHQWIDSISVAGVPSTSQPAYADIASPPGSAGYFAYNSAGTALAGASTLVVSASGKPNLPAGNDPTPVAGDVWNSTTSGGLSFCRASGLTNRVGGPIFSAVNGSLIQNTTTPTSLFAGATVVHGSRTIPAGTLKAGNALRVDFIAPLTATASPTLTIALQVNGSTIASGGTAASVSPGNLTTISFLVAFLAVGASGSVAASFQVADIGTATGSAVIFGAANPAAIDTTVALTIDLLVTWGTASVGNKVNLGAATIHLF